MNIIKIRAKPQKGSNAAKVEVMKLRVAAYCRVSTDNEEQASSYEAQIAHYTEFISKNPEWELVGVYADDGISATSTKNRDEFNRMIADCKNGLIDIILTKSISRFARNKDADGNLVINAEQAEIVKRIFREYLEGASCQRICRGLERDGILTARGNPRWHDSTVRKILENEKYMGDALLQKTYTVDFLKKKRVKNTGIMPQYYIEGHHEPIIPKELFLQVQEEIARRGSEMDCLGKKRRFSANHAFSQIVFCAGCNEQYRRIHWNNHGRKSVVWRCMTRLHHKNDCSARTVSEEMLQGAFLDAVNDMVGNSRDYLRTLHENLETAIHLANPDSVEYLDARMADLQRELIERTARHENYDDLAEEILRLREVREQAMMDDVDKTEYQNRIRELQEFIRSQPKRLSFNETLVKHLLSKVTVFEDHLVFEFKSGVAVSVEK
ncbi:MAG: recombinase family protein [Oscillospiraceae bacterium]|nr:recombinase family protein [Oscillospiraceae bacterium]